MKKKYIELDRVMEHELGAGPNGDQEPVRTKQYLSIEDIEIVSDISNGSIPSAPEGAKTLIGTKSGRSFFCAQSAKEVVALKYGE